MGAVATLVAGHAGSPGLEALLDRYPCDGFIDLAWPESLAAAALRIALGHVALGRNMVEIQQVVIEQAREDMTSLYDRANHDGLTNLFNQRYFAQLMERQHASSAQRHESYALVFIDLDDLKRLNTRYGHAGGSRALNELAGTIATSIRSTRRGGAAGRRRVRGVPGGCDQADGTDFAQRLCSTLRNRHFEMTGSRWRSR